MQRRKKRAWSPTRMIKNSDDTIVSRRHTRNKRLMGRQAEKQAGWLDSYLPHFTSCELRRKVACWERFVSLPTNLRRGLPFPRLPPPVGSSRRLPDRASRQANLAVNVRPSIPDGNPRQLPFPPQQQHRAHHRHERPDMGRTHAGCLQIICHYAVRPSAPGLPAAWLNCCPALGTCAPE